MGTIKEKLRDWFKAGVEIKATHMIVVVDTFDYDYPVYVKEGEEVQERMKEYDNVNMQKIMEIYNLRQDMEAQLAQHRAMNIDDSEIPNEEERPPAERQSTHSRSDSGGCH